MIIGSDTSDRNTHLRVAGSSLDEAQDFEDAWVQALLAMAGPNTRVFVLEDSAQKLYKRETLQMPNWAVLESPVNYRSPRAVVEFINALELTDTPIEWGGAVLGEEPRFYEHDSSSLLTALEQAVQDFLDEGFKPEQMAVLTLRGVANSPLFTLSPNSQVAGLRFKRATGQFTKEGSAIYSEGELLLETVHRFKGQAADAVVLVGEVEGLGDARHGDAEQQVRGVRGAEPRERDVLVDRCDDVGHDEGCAGQPGGEEHEADLALGAFGRLRVDVGPPRFVLGKVVVRAVGFDGQLALTPIQIATEMRAPSPRTHSVIPSVTGPSRPWSIPPLLGLSRIASMYPMMARLSSGRSVVSGKFGMFWGPINIAW